MVIEKRLNLRVVGIEIICHQLFLSLWNELLMTNWVLPKSIFNSG